MRRSTVAKFPNSVQLFRFCQKVLVDRRKEKVHDQEVGAILDFNPSDCSHWKRGEKNVKSVFALAKLAEALEVEPTLIHDVAGGITSLDEAFYEYTEAQTFDKTMIHTETMDAADTDLVRERVETFVDRLHKQADFSTPPLYLPEVLRFFPFISTQSVEMMDKLSRILRVKPGQYIIQFKKGELKPQTRMSMTKDLSRIIFEAERKRFPELSELQDNVVDFEELTFTANVLIPKKILLDELERMDNRRNVVNELATHFWVPKSLICFQLKNMLSNLTSIKIQPSLEYDHDTTTATQTT